LLPRRCALTSLSSFMRWPCVPDRTGSVGGDVVAGGAGARDGDGVEDGGAAGVDGTVIGVAAALDGGWLGGELWLADRCAAGDPLSLIAANEAPAATAKTATAPSKTRRSSQCRVA